MADICGWDIDYSACTSDAGDAFAALPVEQRDRYEEMAREYLARWTGWVYGRCPATIRPCRDVLPAGTTFSGTLRRAGGANTGVAGAGVGTGLAPVMIAGRWFNLECVPCTLRGQSCDCTHTSAVRLPYPAFDVTEVKVDGVVLPASAYRLDYYGDLYRTDGHEWPLCQNLAADDTEANTFAVTFTRSRPVPPGGSVAAGVLAREFYLAACGSDQCQLPRRIQQISRQDVTVAFDDFSGLTEGQTGIWLVDSWVASITKPPRASGVYSPDTKRRR